MFGWPVEAHLCSNSHFSVMNVKMHVLGYSGLAISVVFVFYLKIKIKKKEENKFRFGSNYREVLSENSHEKGFMKKK